MEKRPSGNEPSKDEEVLAAMSDELSNDTGIAVTGSILDAVHQVIAGKTPGELQALQRQWLDEYATNIRQEDGSAECPY